jgi:hypothetical protein
MATAVNPLEDWRGVDVGQIRRQLSMSVEERVRDMVDVANKLISMREYAATSRARRIN